ncbi:nicotinate phosphoribosyltransferase [Eubacteriales bacterium OttesenSCG-928-A19]|nr:nicotinate phosphoribosyltransferase [Eubacteriales bacterium OttesenSCG-928-A19]
MQPRNLTMLTDLYQLTMMYGYFRNGMGENRSVFDLFYRKGDERISLCIAAGLEQAVEYIQNLRFEPSDLDYLRSLGMFDETFLSYLKEFRFTGDVDAVPEGTVVFPGEPLVQVRASLMQAQLLETALLNIVNHQTLIASKARRVVQAAEGGSVLEFGLRRAQGPDAGIYGARAAIIGGCDATSNVYTAELFDVPVRGTHAHSWVMSFPTELEAFRAYASVFPDNSLLLVDTYDTLKSGVPNAITVFRELEAKGYRPAGIRLDSGDMAYLSRKARVMLDEAGFPDAKICASSDLDEEVIWDLKAQGARVDIWGVGTRMITGGSTPALGGVYKLVAEEIDGQMHPRIKISENPIKITNPGVKKLYRIHDNRTGHAIADLIALEDEVYDEQAPLELFDSENTWKRMTVSDYTMRPLLSPIFRGGKLVYDMPPIQAIAEHTREELATFWAEYKRLNKPQLYKVDLSQPLWDLKQALLNRR